MTETATRPKAPPPPPPRSNGAPPAPAPKPATAPAGPVTFGESSGRATLGDRVGLYGPGGIGKSSLAALAPSPKFLDIEDSTGKLDIRRIVLPAGQVWTYELVRGALQANVWGDCETVVLDSATKLEQLCAEQVLRTVPMNNRGERANRIEDYGYGKGYGFIYDAFLPVLGDLDRLWRAGKNVVVVAHSCANRVPNPEGEDWLRYEPKLSDPPSGKGSVRLAFREWLDHLLFLHYDMSVNEAGKARGNGTRTIYPVERPWLMAKSRSLREPIVFKNETDAGLWSALSNRE